MESEDAYDEIGNSAFLGQEKLPLIVTGSQPSPLVVPRAMSAPSSKVLSPGTKGHPKPTCSAPLPATPMVKTLDTYQAHLQQNVSGKKLIKRNKVLPPEKKCEFDHVQQGNGGKFNPSSGVNSKVYDTGTNYTYAASYQVIEAEVLDEQQEKELPQPFVPSLGGTPLPSLPFEILGNNDSQFQTAEEGMEVEEEMVVDDLEEDRVNVKDLKRKPHAKYRPGLTLFGTKDALVNMVLQMSALSDEETGIITTERLWFLCSEERKEVVRRKVLGRGTFGVVNLYMHDQTDYVVKQINKDFHKNEILLMSELCSPYIVLSYGMIIRNKIPEIIMEYGGQSMLQVARTHYFSDKDIWDLAYQGLCALEYLHSKDICHHDIKPENILLMYERGVFNLKLADFGAAKRIGEENDMVGWTTEYLSPERAWVVLLFKFPDQLNPIGSEKEDITGKSDIYSLGLSLLYAYERSHVFLKFITGGENVYKDEERRIQLQVELLVEINAKRTLALDLIPATVSRDMKFVLIKLLQGSHLDRCTAEEGKNWMQFLSNLAIQQKEKAQQVQASSSCQVNTGTSQTDAVPVTFRTRKTRAVLKNKAPQEQVASPLVYHESWNKAFNEGREETLENLPSGLKNRIVKRKLNSKLSGKRMKTSHNKTATSTAQLDNIIVIDEEDPTDGNIQSQTDPAIENSQPQVEGPGNLPNMDFLFSNT